MITWTFVAIFIATAIITLGGLVKNFKLIEVEEPYLKRLFVALILEVVTAGVAFAVFELKSPEDVPIHREPPSNVESAGALIVGCQNNRPAMLGVLHNIDGHTLFAPPAGKSNMDEDPSSTAKRETREETGYSIDVLGELGNSQKGNTNFSLVLAKVDKSVPADPNIQEVVGLLWIDPSEVPSNSWRFPEQREWIIELFEEHSTGICSDLSDNQTGDGNSE